MQTLPDTFAVFILTHGRPDNVITYKTLQKCGYTGKLYFIVDDEDKTVDRYIENFGEDSVIIFNKRAQANLCDRATGADEMRTVLMARNACFDIAERLELTHFLQLDDDYSSFEHRSVSKCSKKLLVHKVTDLDKIIQLYLDYYISGGFAILSFAQGGDFIGGVSSGHVKNNFPLYRKVMNSFFCAVDRPFNFVGALNDDVNTYVTHGSRGLIIGMVSMIAIVQKATQSNAKGLTDMYLSHGTYCKSFTTVLMQPSSVSVNLIPGKHRRIHHSINWKATVPCILREKHRKTDDNKSLPFEREA